MTDMPAVIDRLLKATNAHDVDALVDCFADDYVNVTPAHPARGFSGREQVRRNWTAIFAGVPDISARILDFAHTASATWTEWEMTGTRRDGAPHAMAGVMVFGVTGERISSIRFFLEPVDTETGDVNAAVQHVTNGSSS